MHWMVLERCQMLPTKNIFLTFINWGVSNFKTDRQLVVYCIFVILVIYRQYLDEDRVQQ